MERRQDMADIGCKTRKSPMWLVGGIKTSNSIRVQGNSEEEKVFAKYLDKCILVELCIYAYNWYNTVLLYSNTAEGLWICESGITISYVHCVS
jgi:hypothetical protein